VRQNSATGPQAETAQLLGRSPSFVSRYERRERRLDLVEVVEVATALGVEPCDLVQDVARSLQLGRPAT
jgi:transcriptional regulator with XRE-family HTH domain